MCPRRLERGVWFLSLTTDQQHFVSPKDPSRNHRAYRLTAAKLDPPIIPFMPLLIKGNLKTHPGQAGGSTGGVRMKDRHPLGGLSGRETLLALIPTPGPKSPKRVGRREGCGKKSL